MISHSHITRRFILDLGPIFRCGITPYFNKSPWPLTLSRHTYPFSIINRIKISHNVLITLLNVHLKRFSKIGYNRTCKNVYILTMQASYLIAKPGTIPLGSIHHTRSTRHLLLLLSVDAEGSLAVFVSYPPAYRLWGYYDLLDHLSLFSLFGCSQSHQA